MVDTNSEATSTNDTADQGEGEKEEVKFSPEQQAKLDELIKNRIGEVNKKHATELDQLKQQHQSEMEEFKKTSKMKDDEKNKYENEKAMKELEELRKEKSEREHQDKINALFTESGINPKISSKLFYHLDEKTAKADLDNFKKVFDDAVLDEVNKRINSHTPKTTASEKTDSNPFIAKHNKFNFTPVK